MGARDFEWLFNLRDAAVHHKETTGPPEPHPIGVRTAAANVDYSLESASRAVDIVLDVLQLCVTSPRPATTAWAEAMRGGVDLLVARRAARTLAHRGADAEG